MFHLRYLIQEIEIVYALLVKSIFVLLYGLYDQLMWYIYYCDQLKLYLFLMAKTLHFVKKTLEIPLFVIIAISQNVYECVKQAMNFTQCPINISKTTGYVTYIYLYTYMQRHHQAVDKYSFEINYYKGHTCVYFWYKYHRFKTYKTTYQCLLVVCVFHAVSLTYTSYLHLHKYLYINEESRPSEPYLTSQ